MRNPFKRDGAEPDRPPVPFVVGMNRSGTTLLRMMLDAHPDLTIPPETHFVPDLIKAAREDDATPESALEAMKSAREWGDFGFSDEMMLGRLRALPKIKPGPAVRTFYDAYTEEQGKPRWGEKTPTYVQKMRLIQRAIPEARFVHVIRDGRDVALSVLDRTVRELTAADIGRRWQKKITKAREDSPKLDHYMEIRYEDLILDTEPVLRSVCEFIELPWDDGLLSYHERSAERLQEMARALPAEGRAKELSVERRLKTHEMTTKPPSADRVARWRTQMSPEQRDEFEAVAGSLLAELGYPTGPDAVEQATALMKPRSFPTMRVGIVTKWFASGQAVVSRYVRGALDGLGHETFVLAKPGKGPRANQERVADPVWDQPGVTEGSEADIPTDEYLRWASDNALDAVLCDQNDQFDEIRALREAGVRTIGRFVWESFAPEDTGPAREAYDTIYSYTRAEQERYRELGIGETPLLTYGCHPELIEIGAGVERSSDEVWFYVPGSFMGKRKPFPEIVEAFTRANGDHLRLLIRGQVDRKGGKLVKAAGGDERVKIELEDRPTDEHLAQFAQCIVCLSPSRWEGLGLPLFEAMAFGMPSITNDSPPMNEAVIDGRNGICVDSVPWGEAGSGIPAFDPDFGQLTAAIERLGDGDERERLARGAVEMREGERSWQRTIEGLQQLLGD